LLINGRLSASTELVMLAQRLLISDTGAEANPNRNVAYDRGLVICFVLPSECHNRLQSLPRPLRTGELVTYIINLYLAFELLVL
jgi:hypothetical protein